MTQSKDWVFLFPSSWENIEHPMQPVRAVALRHGGLEQTF